MFSGLNQTAGSKLPASQADQPGKQGLQDLANASQSQNRPSIFGNLGAASNFQLGVGNQNASTTSTGAGQAPSIYSNTHPIVSREASLPTLQSFTTSSFPNQQSQLQLQNQPGGQQQQLLLQQQENGTTRLASFVQATQPAYFNSLLERGKKRHHTSTGDGGPGQLPSLQLGLDDIRRTARGMGNAGLGTPQQRAEDNKA
jgi:nuclear pore complex protein Nup93